MSPSLQRWRTLHAYHRCLAELGPEHPATWSAYARGRETWTPARWDIPWPPEPASEACARAYTVAQLRALNAPGHDNRRERRYWRERAARLAALPESLRNLILSSTNSYVAQAGH